MSVTGPIQSRYGETVQ